MSWRLTDDIDEFDAAAGQFLASRPVQHTVFLTVIDALRRRGPHTYGPQDPVLGFWRTAEGTVDGVLLRTPPHPMMVSPLPADAVPAAAAAVPLTPAVNLLAEAEDAFAAAWQRRTGQSATATRRTRLYRLGELADPAPPGRARLATDADRSLLMEWHAAFHDEIGEAHHGDLGAAVDDRIAYGGLLIWEDGGRPVAMAIHSRPDAGMARVQIVYTPPDQRGHGYAAGATVAATRSALATGVRDVVLNTDLANPTSNRLYRRLGYRPVEDRVILEFAA
ncbi:N-acetyltransferase [Paractinoplanes deccanensis]|uniref:N-acetyltransferase n=1 Tax=Paractinoplanes deccanensis TaxID=113561 RepID=A0ABQ3Y1X7_9ACTN|nr:GNAT family N-acetyltransferase [Actinoplanes deccanensis]GID73970.1 N-acetyltransferase [Actinoplanes deccanensis]